MTTVTFLPLDVRDLLVVVLHQDRAVAQGVELAGVGDGGLAHRVAVGVVEFGRPADAGGPLDDRVNLALPATSERPLDLVLARDRPPGREIESLGWSLVMGSAVHLGRPHHAVLTGACRGQSGSQRECDKLAETPADIG